MRAPVSAQTSFITSKLLINDDEDDSRASEIGKDEAVIFVNPTKYSLEQDDSDSDSGDKSAFDKDIIEESDHDPEKGNLSKFKQKIVNGDEELQASLIQPELVIAFRDRKQMKKIAKEKAKSDQPEKKSFLKGLFSRKSTTQVRASTTSNDDNMSDSSSSLSSDGENGENRT